MAGRPTILTETLVEEAGKYLATCEDTYEVVGEGKATTVIQHVNLPTIEGLALFLNIHRDTIYAWEKPGDSIDDEQSSLQEAFSDIVTRVRHEQAKRLINKGLGGQYASQIAKPLLSKHGYNEKTETDITTKGEAIGVPDPTLATGYAEYLKNKK